jgi:hypothetical protein
MWDVPSVMSDAKWFNISVTSLNNLHNHFDDPTKLFSDLNPAKFLGT